MPAAHSDQPAWTACFTPGQDCTGVVVGEIDSARASIRVQGYSFTSVRILAAIKVAHARGVVSR
jgi:phosphatidylserine/phosphatidylglycerophosphate/cardiolipin synthase-like enzyme